MVHNTTVDDKLIEEARRIGGHRTRKAAVTAALKEYIRYRKQMAVRDLAGTIDFDPEYDYESERERKN